MPKPKPDWVDGAADDVQDLARQVSGKDMVAAGHLSRAGEAIRAGDRDEAQANLTAAYDSLSRPLRGLALRRLDSEHMAAEGPLDLIRAHLDTVIARMPRQAGWADATRAGLAPEPRGKPGGPGLYGLKGKGHSAYFEHIVNDLIEGGTPEGKAYSLTWGILRNYAAGHDGKGNRVSAETQAKAVAALAEEKQRQAEAKATRSTVMTTDTSTCDADGLDESWDGDHDDLPDLTGLTVEDLDAAAGGDGNPDLSRVAKLGTGARFSKLKASLTAKGAKNPGALAAYIGKQKYGKGKFAALAAKARGGGPASASRSGEIFRFFPLEVCRIMPASEGREYAGGRTVEAYAAVYDQDAEIRDHEGHYIENIDPGAHHEILRMIAPERNGGFWNATCLYNHGMTIHGTPAERFSLPAGLPRHISAESQGLLTRTEYAPTPLGDELLSLVEMGALRTQSFTGAIMRSTPALRGPGDRYRARGGVLERVRRLALGLREYGLTPFAAYSGAEVLGVRMQLPGSFDDADDPDSAEFEEFAPDEGDDTGSPPEDGTATRSTGNRLYQLRTQELLAQHGITLNG